jgi:anaerobic magnesium-protoporphyrin IX monomethyl ester cyclase
MQPLHVTLIRPPSVTFPQAMVGTPASPSLALALLAAFLKRHGYEVTAIDSQGEALSQYTPLDNGPYRVHGLTAEQIVARIPRQTRVVGLSCMFSNEWIYHRRVIDRIAEHFPGVPVVIGGEHATAAGAYILRSCPGVVACALGEGEETLLEVVQAIERGGTLGAIDGLMVRDESSGEIRRTNPRKRIRALDQMPWPDWDAVPLRNYLDRGFGHGVGHGRNMPMLASRGCPYKCTFCSNPQMWGNLWNVRSTADVLAEMKHHKEKYSVDSFSFYDLTAIMRRSWILEFTELLIKEDLRVTWLLPSGTRSEAMDAEVVRQLKRSGCLTLNFAPESGSPRTLERIKKQVHLEKMLVSVRACARAGVYARANIIFGFPGETPHDMLLTLRFILRLAWAGLHDIGVFPFAPYPGSALHDFLRARHAFPPEGPEYDQMLLRNCNNDYWHPRSWNEYVSNRQLRLLLIGGSALFYLSQYAFRPWRAIESIGRLAMGRPVTFMERVVANSLGRVRLMFGAKGSLPAPVAAVARIDLAAEGDGSSPAHPQRSTA